MTFTERPFFYLLLVAWALWWACRHRDPARQAVLLVASLVFYGFHQWELLFLILAYCVVDWQVGKWIAHSAWPRGALALGVAFNLTLLAYWKYTPLVVRSAAQLALSLDLPVAIAPAENWLIPVGISFYAFTGIAYLVDVYRGHARAETDLGRFTLFITFFPQLVAGPILRSAEFLPSLQAGSLPRRPEAPLEALSLLARGFFKKLVLADRIAPAIDPFFQHVADGSTQGVWALPYVYLYALQIYFDFSAYSDIARGLGLLFGFRWPENFNVPYLATSVQDFWRRWHITLSTFLKDYLYIPLGGNRGGRWKSNRNLMLTMLLGGLWHGASWSFLAWGGLHGLFLVVHRTWADSPAGRQTAALRGIARAVWRAFATLLTFHAVCLAWCFFRLNVFGESLACIEKCFRFDGERLLVGGLADASLWLLLALYGVAVGLSHSLSGWESPKPVAVLPRGPSFGAGFRWGAAATVLLLAFLLSSGAEAPPFIYFQF